MEKMPQAKGPEKNPAALLIEARKKLQKAEDEYTSFETFAKDIQQKFGKRIQQFDPSVPKEKEFIDYWNAEEKRFRDETEKWEKEIADLEQTIHPLSGYQPGMAAEAQRFSVESAVEDEKRRQERKAQ